jgi:hypothetical protein
MRRLSPKSALAAFPELLSGRDAADLIDRWEAVLSKAPRLRGYLEHELGRHRLRLQERTASEADLERTLCECLSRWLTEFEALPQFAVSAIATTIEEDGIVAAAPVRFAADAARRGRAEAHDLDSAELADPAARSPEAAVGDAEALLGDPVFALAFHCIEVRVRPQLAVVPPELAGVPEAVWFGLLHATAKPSALLTADVAISLVLRVLGAAWTNLPASSRTAALRLFGASAADVRAPGGAARQVCDALPPVWGLTPGALPAFVAAAARTRVAASDAGALCRRIAASVGSAGRRDRGGFALLEPGTVTAAPEELSELEQNARKHPRIAGFRKLIALL